MGIWYLGTGLVGRLLLRCLKKHQGRISSVSIAIPIPRKKTLAFCRCWKNSRLLHNWVSLATGAMVLHV